jgi:hypothetical protein
VRGGLEEVFGHGGSLAGRRIASSAVDGRAAIGQAYD